MPRYLIERRFPAGLAIPGNVDACAQIVGVNDANGVNWLQSYVSADRTTTFCLYDAPAPEAIRKAARRNGLPVSQITEIAVLTPYCYY